ncbi:MAG: O-antigen ligase family protein [Anaerolineales bacterium]
MTRSSLTYLTREAVLILLWAYVLLVGGTVNGLIAFPMQAASTVVATVCVGGWLVWSVWQRRALPATGLGWAVIVFVAAQALATLLSQDVRRSLPLVVQSIAYVAIFYCAYDLTRAGWPAELTEKTLLIVGAIVVSFGLLDVARAWAEWRELTAGLAYAPDFQYRTYAVLGDANLLAAGLNLLIVPAVARAIATPHRVPRILLGIFVVAALALQTFTASRGGQAGLFVALGTLALLWVTVVSLPARERASRTWQWLRRNPVALAALAVLIVLGFGVVLNRILSFRGSATQGPALFARTEYWGPALAAFATSPGWGVGPGTFPTEFMLANSTPPTRPYLHAHSVLFNTLAESGMLGLAAGVFAVGMMSRALWRARNKSSLAARARWAAACACGAGWLAHSQVDDHTRYLAVAVPLLVLIACALADESEGQPQGGQPQGLPLQIACGLALAFNVYSLRAYAIAVEGVNVGHAGDWTHAAERFDAATTADPWLGLYPQQAGYAYGRLAASGDAHALPSAIARYERAATLEPQYALHHANLGALYWQAGRRADAVSALQRATELAPRAADFWLSLGLYLETSGFDESARAAYQRVLALNPAFGDAHFWAETRLRDSIRIAPPPTDAVRGLIEQKRFDEAERVLAEQWGADPQQSRTYALFAELARARGDLDLAERSLRAALWVQTVDVGGQLPVFVLAAEIAQQRGDDAAARARYATAYAAVTDYGSLGWGTAGWTPHAYFVYQRSALALDVLPQLTRLDLTPDFARRLLPLADLYAHTGNDADAVAVYQRLRRADPTLP